MGLYDIRKNPLVLTDAYNLYHGDFKVNVDFETSHIYNRKSGIILFGFNELVTRFMELTVTKELIEEADSIAKAEGLRFPCDLFHRVIKECNGRIPLRIQALPDGTWVPPGTPFAQVSNTVKGFGELVTWWEGVLLHNYFASGCATEAMRMRMYLEKTRRKYGYDESFLLRFHSFGFRGHRSLEDAYWAGSAWGLFLKGSDDFHIGLHHPESGLTSIPALAHKVVQQFDDEFDCFTRAIDVASEAGAPVVALVIDTWDAYKVIKHYVKPLSKYAELKGNLKRIVFRPDSGDTWKQTVDIWDVVRDNNLQNVGVIIGEGMSLEQAQKADRFFLKNNVPLDFVAYGIGAGFYKHIERDTLGYAMKTAWSNGGPRMKFSENPLKRSIPGKVALTYKKDDDSPRSMWVCQENEVDAADNLYMDIYHYMGVDRIQFNYGGDYGSIQMRAEEEMWTLMERGEDGEQTFIVSSQATKDLVRKFKSLYRQ